SLLLLLMAGCESLPDLSQVLDVPTAEDVVSTETIAAGLREALSVGSERAVSTLGRPDGFLKSAFHIPLPDSLLQARDVASRFGLAGVFDDMEVRLNRAAEAAAPKAQKLFVSAIRQLTFDDVIGIYRGPDDAATRYLRRTTGTALRAEMRPIIDESLAEVGALNAFRSLAEQYNRLPLVTPIDADLTSHVLDHAADALFAQVAREEGAIRRDPAKRTTELLRKVFG
ncbi:MAG: DUF4197 domain-containing protein, partial [Gammaproteobacteria bacterium]